jgi:hypothetical protein
MLRILGQLASTVALLFAAAALIGTTYLAGYLGGFGVSLTTIRLDPGTAVITALVPTVYLLPAMLVAFGYVFSVAVGLAAADVPVAGSAAGRPTFRQRWFDEALLEGVGFALIAAVISVGFLAATLLLLNLPRSPDVLLVNVILPAIVAVLGIFPAHWIVNSPRFEAETRVWWSMLGIIVWAVLVAVVTYILGAAVARQYTDQLSSPVSQPRARVEIRDALPGLAPSGSPTALGAVTYDGVVLLFRDEQAWLFAVGDPGAPRGFRTILVPTIQMIGVTGVD